MSIGKMVAVMVCVVSAIGGLAQDAPRPVPVSLCSISFERDIKRPARVDNEAKACLDDVSLNMQRSRDARLVITGRFGTNERSILADQRAVNTKDYLVHEKGIEQFRIEVRAGTTAQGKTVVMSLIPTGAEAAKDSDSHTINEKTVKPTAAHRTDY